MAPIDHLMWVVPDLEARHRRARSAAPACAQRSAGATHRWARRTRSSASALACTWRCSAPTRALAEPTGFGATLAAEPAPRLASWAVRTNDIESVCATLTDAGWPVSPTPMTRTRTDGSTLTWSLAVLPGRPLGDHWPFVIDWGSSPHPSDSAPGPCTLERLVVTDSDPWELQRLLAVVEVDGIVVEQGAGSVRATLGSPLGPVEL